MFKIIKSWLLILIFVLVGCNNVNSSYNKKIALTSNNESYVFNVEIAEDDISRARGLMYREKLADDEGMLFVFDNENFRSFWMKNTKIPLDLLFFDQSGDLVDYKDNFPPCPEKDICDNYVSKAKAKYVLEVNSDVLNENNFYQLKIDS